MKSRKKGAAGKRAKSPQETSREPALAESTKISQQAPQVDVVKGIAQRREEESKFISPRPRGPRIADPRDV